MSLVRDAPPMTLDEFLAWEEKQEVKHEFDGFGPIAMAGGTRAHAAIQRNLAVSLGSRLRGKPCQFYGSDLKIEVKGRIRYPDGFVVCSPLPDSAKVVRDPVVIFEVLSESSSSTDLITKNREYASTPSIKRYVVLAQDKVGGTVFERVNDDWVGHLIGRDTALRMPEIGIEVGLAEFYDGLTFPPDPDGVEPAEPVSAAPSP